MRIKLIVCYYGKFPDWMDLWLESCKNNPTIDFMVVSDIKLDCLPINVELINMSFEELQSRFSNVLGFKCCLNNPYKLCDYKPLYGEAFYDYLSGYDFWGYCDIDLIWGNIREFLQDKILKNNDKIGKYGHFMIYRNNEKFRQLFKQRGGAFSYETVFKHSNNFGFDEMTGMNRIAKKNNIKTFNCLKIANMSTKFERMRLPFGKSYPEFFCYENGNIYRVYLKDDNYFFEKYMYLHFSEKKPKNNVISKYKTNFYIFSDFFITRYNSNFSKEEILKNSKYIDEKNDILENKKCRQKKFKKIIQKSFFDKYIWLKIQLYLRFINKFQ